MSVSKALKDINDSLNKSKGDAEDLAELKAKEPKNKVEKSAAGVAKGLEPVSKNVVDSKDAYEGLSVKKSMTDAAKAPKRLQKRSKEQHDELNGPSI